MAWTQFIWYLNALSFDKMAWHKGQQSVEEVALVEVVVMAAVDLPEKRQGRFNRYVQHQAPALWAKIYFFKGVNIVYESPQCRIFKVKK